MIDVPVESGYMLHGINVILREIKELLTVILAYPENESLVRNVRVDDIQVVNCSRWDENHISYGKRMNLLVNDY